MNERLVRELNQAMLDLEYQRKQVMGDTKRPGLEAYYHGQLHALNGVLKAIDADNWEYFLKERD